MDRTSWKPKIYKATESVDYKAEESICPQCNSSDTRKMELDLGGTGYVGKDSGIRKYDDYLEQCNNCGKIFTDGNESKAEEEGTSDGAKKGWLTRQRGGSAEEPKKDFTPIDWAGQVGATKSEADQDKASDLMDKYYELVNEPMMDLPEDGSAMEERKAIHAKGVADFKAYLESSGSATVNQDVRDILEDENYHSLNKMLTKEEPETQSSRDKEFYDQSTQNTLDTLNQSKVNGFPFFSYVGQPKQVISDGKGGIILYGMKRNPNSIRRVDVKYDEGRDTYTVSFMSNRNKPKGEYNDVYFDQLSGLIAGNKGLGVESYATEDDYKYDWDQLTSLAQKALSDIGYDKKSWNQEPEDIRKEMEKVAYSEENWKEVANKFYKEELNKNKKNGGEAMYGYGSATGRMSPVEAWNQGADVYGDMGYDQSLRNPIFDEFRGLQWNELPTDIQETWKSELGYMTKGEGLVDNIEKQLNKFGVNLDRDPEQVEESKADEGYGRDGKYRTIGNFHSEWVEEQFKRDGSALYCKRCGKIFPEQEFSIRGANDHLENDHNLMDPAFESKANEEEKCERCDGEGTLSGQAFDEELNNMHGHPEEIKNFAEWGTCPECDGKGYESYSNEADPCWKGYKQIGMKDKNGKQVPNCVPESKANEYDCESCGGEYSKCPHCGHAMHDYEWEDSNDVCDSCEKGKYDESLSNESKLKANEEGVNDWWDRVTTDGGDLDMQFRGTHFNELPLHQQNHYFNLYMEELGSDKYGNHMALYDTQPDSYSSSDLWKDDPSLGNKDQYYTGWKINEPTVDSFDRLEISGLNGSTRDNDMMKFLVKTTESKASEAEDDWVDKYFEFTEWIEDGEFIGYLRKCKLCGMKFESLKIGEQREHLINNHKGFTRFLNELEGNISSYEGFNQGLYGYVDAKCKTCGGLEFGSIEDMNDHFAMNSDHVSNLNDLDSDIPNSD